MKWKSNSKVTVGQRVCRLVSQELCVPLWTFLLRAYALAFSFLPEIGHQKQGAY
jgi:hypothetical protein